jgi:glycosyltransferase involved in cell wall biosynthesis
LLFSQLLDSRLLRRPCLGKIDVEKAQAMTHPMAHEERRPLHIIFLNRFFHPDQSATSQMLSDLAFALAARGRKVSVITSRQRFDQPGARLPGREVIDGVDIHRVPTSRFGRSYLPGRVVDYLAFCGAAAWTLLRLARCGDVIVAKTDPPMLSVIAAPLTRLRRARLVNWLQDIFPETAEALKVGGVLARAAYRPLRWLRDRSLRRADMNVVLGERMVDRLVGLGVDRARIRLIANWANGDLIRPIANAANGLRREWGLTDTFTVGYSGNLGRAHDIDTMLAAIAAIQTECHAPGGPARTTPAIRWVFIGGGAMFHPLQTALAQRALDGIVFKPYQPRERLAEGLSAIDVHLISLRPELEGLIVPSKFYGIAAAGRPAIFIGDQDGEIARLLRKHRCGLIVAQGDGAALGEAVLALARNPTLLRQMGKHARTAFDAGFGAATAVAHWEKLLRDVAGDHGRLGHSEGPLRQTENPAPNARLPP